MTQPDPNTFAGLRRTVALALGRVAYGLFYAVLLLLTLGVPAGVGYLLWHWLTH